MEPDHQTALNNRGSVYNDLEKYELALIDLNHAISLLPNDVRNANAYRHRAYSHYKLLDFGQAIEDVNTAISMNDDYPEAKKLRNTIWRLYSDSINMGIEIYNR